MSHQGTHPREFVECANCGAQRWEKHRSLPQIGQTYICVDCGHEVYVYDAGGRGDTRRQWRPVTASIARDLLVFASEGVWPDTAVRDLLNQGVARGPAIDYYMVERDDRSQSAWADDVGVSQQAVSKNVDAAREKIDDNH